MKTAKKLTQTETARLEVPKSGQRIYRDSEMKGFIVRVTAHGAKSYCVEKKVKGKTIRRTIGATNVYSNEKARLEAKKLLLEMGEGIDPKATEAKQKIKAITLAEVFEQYKKDSTLRPRTIGNFDYTINKCLSDWLDLPFSSISREMVENRLDKTATANGPKGEGKAMAGQCYKLLRLLVRFAQRKYEIDGKPVIEIDCTRNLSKQGNKKRPWTECKRRESVIQEHQLVPWFEAVLTLKNTTVRDWLILTLCLGLRKSEGLKLKFADISWQGKYLKIVASNSKTGNERLLPLSDYLLDMLKARLDEYQLKTPYVFCSPKDPKTWLQEPKRVIKQVIDKSGVQFMCHDLRRTAATLGYGAVKIPLNTLKLLLGHSMQRESSDITSSYVVLTLEDLRGPAQQLTDYLLEKGGVRKSEIAAV